MPQNITALRSKIESATSRKEEFHFESLELRRTLLDLVPTSHRSAALHLINDFGACHKKMQIARQDLYELHLQLEHAES